MSYSPTILARAEARLKQAQEAHRRQQAQQSRPPSTRPCPGRRRSTAACAKPPPGSWRPPSDRAPIRRAPWPPSAGGEPGPPGGGAGPPHPGRLPRRRPGGHPPLPPVRRPGLEGGRPCAPCLGDLCRQEQIAELSSLLDLGGPVLPNLPPGLLQRPGGPPSTAAPPEAMAPHPPGLPAVWGGVPPVPPPEPLPLRGPGAGEDLPVGLHRPDGGGERVLRGLRHRRQRLCPV